MLGRNGISNRFSVSGVFLITSVVRCYIGKLRIPCVFNQLKRKLGRKRAHRVIEGLVRQTLENRRWRCLLSAVCGGGEV